MNSARLARKWQEAGGDFARMAESLNDELIDDLATKADLRATEATLRSETADLRADIQELRQELHTETATKQRCTVTRCLTNSLSYRTELLGCCTVVPHTR